MGRVRRGIIRYTKTDLFRQHLIEEIAFYTPWGRLWASRDRTAEVRTAGIATELGVAEDVLEDAARLFRSGVQRKRSLLTAHIRVVLPIEASDALQNLADKLGRGRLILMRDLLHAVMLTDKEPTPRPLRQSKTADFRGTPMTGARRYGDVAVSQALHDAIDRRAAACGIATVTYVRNWVFDLIEGRLGWLELPSVTIHETVEAADRYVLPPLAQAQ